MNYSEHVKLFFNERLGEVKLYQDQSKMFKPITDESTSSHATLEPAIKDLTNAVKNLPWIMSASHITAPPDIPAITTPPDIPATTEEEYIEAPEHLTEYNIMGDIATEYFSRYFKKDPSVDLTFGIIKKEDGSHRLMIGDKEEFIKGDDLIINSKTYHETEGLWELIVSKEPNEEIYNDNDMKVYEEIMITSNAMRSRY